MALAQDVLQLAADAPAKKKAAAVNRFFMELEKTGEVIEVLEVLTQLIPAVANKEKIAHATTWQAIAVFAVDQDKKK